MTVNLKPGMTAIRGDGERGGPVAERKASANSAYPIAYYPFQCDGRAYTASGAYLVDAKTKCPDDIIAAGFPWTELGAQVGDTVCCVWDGDNLSSTILVLTQSDMESDWRDDSLYVIVARAAKPAEEPREVTMFCSGVEMMPKPDGWPEKPGALTFWFAGVEYVPKPADSEIEWDEWVDGHCPHDTDAIQIERTVGTFRHRVPKQKPDEVFTIHKRDKAYVLTFPRGSNTGTVVRERL